MDHVVKIVERVVEALTRKNNSIEKMQHGFMPGCSTTDAIFIIGRLQVKYMAVYKPLLVVFVDLEKAFDRVP